MTNLYTEADTFFNDYHKAIQCDLTMEGFRDHSTAHSWGLCLAELEEVRQQGIAAEINYSEVYNGPKDRRYIATMHLAFYRSKIYFKMLNEQKFKDDNALMEAIETGYTLHLTWHMRLRDKFDADGNEKVVHTWLN